MMIKIRVALLCTTAVSLVLAVWWIGPIPQDLQYHQFADTRSLAGISNAWNVLSNLSFLIIGLGGLVILNKNNRAVGASGVLSIARVFYTGLILTALGSAYYHLAPTNATLLWDRLPMALSFMAFFCFVLFMHISERAGRVLLWPLLVLGLASVLYWAYTEIINEGDLRFYAVIQFIPLVLVPLMLVLFPTRTYQSSWIWLIIGLYAVAKLLELNDQALYNMINIGGHTLKHIVASLTGIVFFKAIISAKQRDQTHNVVDYG